MKLAPDVIRRIRLDVNRSQVDLAKLLGTTGTTVGRWERGESSPSPVFKEKLVKLQEYSVARKKATEVK